MSGSADRHYDDADHDTDNTPATAIPVHLQHRSTHITSNELPVDSSSLLCGFVAGICQAGVFNPYDRALYLAVKENRPFFHPQNWKRPYTGFFQSLGGRAAAGGLYFPLEHFFLYTLSSSFSTFENDSDYSKNKNHTVGHLVAGTAAGAVNACVLNPFSAIKYKTWGRTESRGMRHEAMTMLHKSSGSLRPFWNGLQPTVYRDVVFGGCYTWLRLQIPYWYDTYYLEESAVFTTTTTETTNLLEDRQWLGNFVAAGLATILSGPFNYARNVQYSTSSRIRADGTFQVLKALVDETIRTPSALERWKLVTSKLRIGWGTLRVAAGMSYAQFVYDFLSEQLVS